MGKKKGFQEERFQMAVMGRSLLAGALAWILGSGALYVFPKREGHIARLGEWISMLLFSPAEIFLSLILFVVASVILFGLMHFHLYQYVHLRTLKAEHAWMHVTMCLFALFLFVIQFVKMPVPTAIFTVTVFAFGAANGSLLFLGKRKN